MIACPYCGQKLTETTAQCPACQITHAHLKKIMGPMPTLQAALTDSANLLSSSENGKISRATQLFRRRFPQSRINIVLRNFSSEQSLKTILFWVFNTAGLSENTSQHGQNRDVLIIIEPGSGEAGIMIGYGLEPFIPQKALDHIIQQSQTLLAQENYSQALLDIIDRLTALMAAVSEKISQNLGLKEALTQENGEYDY